MDMDYLGSVDGVPFEGGKGEGHALELGSNSFIPGFEEQLVGMNVGETRVITVTFPEQYHSEELAGKRPQRPSQFLRDAMYGLENCYNAVGIHDYDWHVFGKDLRDLGRATDA